MSGFSLRLTHKIMAIGIVGLAGLLVFGTIYQFGSWSEDGSRAIAGGARSVSELNNNIAHKMLEVRRTEKDFALRRDLSYSKRHAELSAAIDRDLDQLAEVTRSNELNDISRNVDAVHRGFDSYLNEFRDVAAAEVNLGLNEKLGLSGSLRDAVHDIEGKLQELNNPSLTSGMLMMRRHEKDYMLRREDKYAADLNGAVSEFAKLLEAADMPQALKAGIAQKLKKYQSDFSAWVVGAQELARHSAAMSKEFQKIEPVIEEIQQNIDQRYKQAGAAEIATRDSVKKLMVIALAFMTIFVGAFSSLIGRSISKAISAMAYAMTKLAGGDSATEIPSLGRKDEVGEMAHAVQIFRDNMVEAERLRAEQAQAEQRQIQQRKVDMVKLADRFEAAVGEIIETVSSASTELEASAGTLTATAERAQKLTTMVAAASEEASTNVQSVASATEEMTSSVNEISRQVQSSARMANEGVDQARKTNNRVSALSQAATRIGDVVELINTIAGQTNLLALNATIEAARAGEAGRGFAVVASEVKALAEQTAKATDEIGQQISGIQSATQDSVGAIKEISGTIEKLSEISSTIAAAVEEQGAATQEISRNVQQAAQGSQQVSSHITDVQRGAHETGSASSQVLSAAQSLSRDSNRLKLEVANFLNSVRAA
jgi:methyl-accepting chemotaxis protein